MKLFIRSIDEWKRNIEIIFPLRECSADAGISYRIGSLYLANKYETISFFKKNRISLFEPKRIPNGSRDGYLILAGHYG